MEKPTNILIVDNDLDYRKTVTKYLKEMGYQISETEDPILALNICRTRMIDLAIIDVRLKNEKDPNDISGIELAKLIPARIPKILITGHNKSTKTLQNVDRSDIQNSHMVYKSDAFVLLIGKVKQLLDVKRSQPISPGADFIMDFPFLLRRNYYNLLQRSNLTHMISMVFIILALMLILIAAGMSLFLGIPLNIMVTFASVLIGSIGAWLRKMAADADRQLQEMRKDILPILDKLARLGGKSNNEDKN